MAGREVIHNVIANAIKYALDAGIDVASYRIATSVPARCCIEIDDGGLGMDEDDRAWAFAPFDCGLTGERATASGLGLALTQPSIEGMGGSLSLHPRPAGDLVVCFLLKMEQIA